MTATSCRPFSKNAAAMVLGEGAAMLVIEPWDRALARGAPDLGEILGYAQSNDASHIRDPAWTDKPRDERHTGKPPGSIRARSTPSMPTAPEPKQRQDRDGRIRAVFGGRAEQIPISATKANARASARRGPAHWNACCRCWPSSMRWRADDAPAAA